MSRSKAQQIAAQSKTVKLEGIDPETGDDNEVEFVIEPLEMQHLMQVQAIPENAAKKRLKEVLYHSLKDDDPNLEREHFEDFHFKFVNELLEVIGEVNGIEDFFSEEEIQQAME